MGCEKSAACIPGWSWLHRARSPACLWTVRRENKLLSERDILLQQFSCDRYLWGTGNRRSSSGWRAVESQDDSEGRSQEESGVRTWMATGLDWSTKSPRVESFCCCLFFFNLRTECLNEPEYMLIWNLSCADISVLQATPLAGGGGVGLGLLLEAGGDPWMQKMQNRPFPWQISGRCLVPVHNPRPRGAWGFQGLVWDHPSGKLPGNRSQFMTQSHCSAYLLLGPFTWYPFPYPATLVFLNFSTLKCVAERYSAKYNHNTSESLSEKQQWAVAWSEILVPCPGIEPR